MTMNPFEYGKALADSWAAAGKALLSAQEDANRAFAEGMKATAAAFGAAPALPELSGDMAELTHANQALMALWSEAATMSALLSSKLPAAGEASPTVDVTFRKMVDPRLWLAGGGEMDEALNRMTEGPRLADLWDVERRFARVLRAWLDVRRRALEHNAVVLEGWLRAGRSFADELVTLPTTGTDPKAPDAKALLALWTETANRVLLEMQRSERFLATQTASIRASTELRAAQRDLVEYYGERFGFPTRTELDDVHRTVTELRRELRALKRRDRPAVTAAAARQTAGG